MARAKTAARTCAGSQMAGRAGARQRPDPSGRDIATQDSHRTPLLEALRDERRAAEQAANDTDTDDEALADEMGRIGLPDAGEGGDSNPLRKRSRRSFRDDTVRWVDVPDEVPEQLTKLLAFCADKNPLWASVGLNNIPTLPAEADNRFALTDKVSASAARFRSNATRKSILKAPAPDSRERVRVLPLTQEQVARTTCWTDPTGSESLMAVGEEHADMLARQGWTCTAAPRGLFSPRARQQQQAGATREAGHGGAGQSDAVGVLLPKYAEVSVDGVTLAKHEALIRAVEWGFEVDGVLFAPLCRWTFDRRRQAWREEVLGKKEVKRLQTLFSDILGVYWAVTHPEALGNGLTVLSGFKHLKAEGGRLLKTVRGERFDVVARLAGERVRRDGEGVPPGAGAGAGAGVAGGEDAGGRGGG